MILLKIKKPCSECPYKQGIVKTLVNPCPSCKENGYKTFEQFQKNLSKNYSASSSINK